MMLAGAFGLILTLWFWNSRRRTVVTAVPAEDRRVVRESRTEYGRRRPSTGRPIGRFDPDRPTPDPSARAAKLFAVRGGV